MNKITPGKNLIEALETAGYEAYYVGGCVRDAIMGREGGDIDITTSATPEEVKAVFDSRRVIETGIKHGTVTVLDEDGVPFEITTFRTEGTYSDNRHPDSVTFVRDLKEDLQRRDFTINAIAMDIRGRVRDPFDGAADIEAGVIRTVGDADERFGEDALRIMRAMRFAAVLGAGGQAFVIEPATEEAMLRNKELLLNVSAERIFTEFKKLVTGAHAGDVVRRYVDILGVVIPELLPMKGFEQRNPYHRYDVLEHCVRAMEVVKTTPENEEYMKIAALFHDIGKPEMFFIGNDGVGHMYGHPLKGEEMVREIMKRLKADRFTSDRITLLVRHHDLLFRTDEKLLKKWLNKFGEEVLMEILHLKHADNIATGNMGRELEDMFNEVEEMIGRIVEAEECFSLKDLAISGADVLKLAPADKKEGPWVGDVLNMILDEVIDGKLVNERSDLLDRAESIIDHL